MANYKSVGIHIETKPSCLVNQTTDSSDIPSKDDIKYIYHNIQEAFHQIKKEDLKRHVDRLKLYISHYTVDPVEFQNKMFPIMTHLCLSSFEDVISFAFSFLSHILSHHPDLMPLLSDPKFFDFCFPFLSSQNYDVIASVLKYINRFIVMHEEARNYVISQIYPQALIQRFIDNEDVVDEVRILSFSVLNNFSNFPIPESLAEIIFMCCKSKLSDDSIMASIFTVEALNTVLNLINNNPGIRPILLRDADFPEMINKYTYVLDEKMILPALQILKFLFFNGKELPVSEYLNFLSLLQHLDQSVCTCAFDCLSTLLQSNPSAVEKAVKNGFFEQLKNIIFNSTYAVKLCAANIACALLENGSRIVIYELFKKGVVHTYTHLLSFENDELIIRLIKNLYNVYEKYYEEFKFISADEESIFLDLINSPSEEVAENARIFVDSFLNKDDPYILPEPVKVLPKAPPKGPNRRYRVMPSEEEASQLRKRRQGQLKLWNRKVIPRNSARNNSNIEENQDHYQYNENYEDINNY